MDVMLPSLRHERQQTYSPFMPICPKTGKVLQVKIEEVSIGRQSVSYFDGGEKIEVPVYSLKHFFDLFPWDRFEFIDYIKIDAQGADFDIIKGAGDYLNEFALQALVWLSFRSQRRLERRTTVTFALLCSFP